MRLAGRYLAGVAVVAGAGGLLALLGPDGARPGTVWGLIAALVLQAPLGWWTLRAMGTERFLLVWGLGMLVRLTVVAIAAMVLIPALGPAATPMLGTMVGALLALLLVEGAAAMREHSREQER